MTAPIRPTTVLVVDDEPHARNGLARLVGELPGFVVQGACGDGTSAIRAIRTQAPDVVLLDVQMPPPDGLEVVRTLAGGAMPAVVFVTAHDRFAIQAFESNAVDYVLKPFRRERLRAALEKARDSIETKRLGEMGRRMLAAAGAARPPAPGSDGDRLVIRSLGRTEVVRVADIVWIEAAGYCVRIHTASRTHVHREALQSLAERLPADRFLRIHRSAIVNAGQIREVRVTPTQEHEIHLHDGTRIPVSRTRWSGVSGLLGTWEGRG